MHAGGIKKKGIKSAGVKLGQLGIWLENTIMWGVVSFHIHSSARSFFRATL